MPARFFVDENDLALGRALDDEHGNVVYPGHPDLPEVPRAALNDEWLPVIGQKGLVVLTRDKRIRYCEAEKRGMDRPRRPRVRPHGEEEPNLRPTAHVDARSAED